MGIRGLLSATAIGVVLIATGAAGALVMKTEQVPSDLRAAADPVTAAVGTQRFDDERSLQAALVVSDPQTLAIRASGTITGSRCRPGHPIVSGSPVLDLDEQPVIALHTTVPLYRDLKSGDKGRDIAALQRELTRLGYRIDATGTYGAGLTAAVKRFEKDAGITKPPGTISLTHYMWLPSVKVTPSSCDAKLGARVSPGAEVVTVAGKLSAVTVKSWPSDLAAGARTISVFGITGPLDSNHTATDTGFMNKVAATADFQAQRASKSTDPPTVTITLAHPLMTWKVPPGAVFALTDNRGCIESGRQTYPVTVVGSGMGAALVTLTGTAPNQVDLGRAITATGCG